MNINTLAHDDLTKKLEKDIFLIEQPTTELINSLDELKIASSSTSKVKSLDELKDTLKLQNKEAQETTKENMKNTEIPETKEDVVKNLQEGIELEGMLKHISTFEEAFPESNSEIKDFGLFTKLKKYFNADSEVLTEIIKRYKISGLNNLFIENSEEIQNLHKELEASNSKKEELNNTVEVLSTKVEGIDSVIQKVNNLDLEKFDKRVLIIEKALDIWYKNQNNINITIGVIGLISPFLTYKGLLSQYDRLYVKPTLATTRAEDLKIIRSKLVGRFNLVSIPLIAIATIYFHNKTPFNNKISTFEIPLYDKNENSILPMFILNSFKKYSKIYIFFIYVSLLLISKLLLYFYPSLFDYFLIAEKYLKYVGLIWILGWILFSLVELYLFMRLSMETFQIGNNYPNFILKWINKLEKESQIKELREIIIGMYTRSLIFFSVLALVYVYILIL